MTTENTSSLITKRADAKMQALEEEIKELERQNLEPPSENTNQGNLEETNETKVTTSLPQEDSVELDPEERSFKKRYGDLRRHQQRREQELQDQINDLKTKLEDAPSSMPTNEDEIKRWAEANPKAAAIVRALAGAEVVKTSQELSTKLKKLEEDNEEIAKEKALNKIRKEHSDFDEIVKSDDFHDWVEKQPIFVQDAVYDGGAQDVIWAINDYKEKLKKPDNGRAAAGNVKTKATAPSVGDGHGTKWSESQVQRMTTKEYEKNEESIATAMRSGNFVYDISGGAR